MCSYYTHGILNREGARKLLEVMDMFKAYIVAMISWVYTYLQIDLNKVVKNAFILQSATQHHHNNHLWKYFKCSSF